MFKQRGFTIIKLSIAIIVLAGCAGWFMNLYKLAGMSFEPITTMLVLRFIGIIPFVGAFVGWF